MRRALIAALLAAAAFVPMDARAHAEEHPIEFSGAVPCGAACAYWNGPSLLGFRPCENPFPPGSYVDIVTEPAPSPPDGKRVLLLVDIAPVVDWDLFICALRSDGSHNGGELGRGHCGLCDPDCSAPLGAGLYGCPERAQTPVQAGTQYVLRAYNWSDPFPCSGSYKWVFV